MAASRGASVGFKAVLFDIDGTLADSFNLGFSATNIVLKEAGVREITEAEYHVNCIYPTPERLARHVINSAPFLAAEIPVGSQEFLRVGTELGRKFDDLYIGLVDTKTAGFYPGIKPLLEELHGRGLKIGALTNAAVAYAEAVLKANGVRNLFLTVHGADDVPKPKPFADGLLVCCGDLGLSPGDCVYVGDAPSDGKAARATAEKTEDGRGMLGVGVSYGSHPEENLVPVFDSVTGSVEGLIKALGKILSEEKTQAGVAS
eukprot:CAMPEP_0172587958 /NCGR_PEP_ID=MMETSP1068-20121228/6929_1 /TAXON_ID=35684 /ORGANISM="Pseudopedinella elastica, Strain CCMP716" /LENGTH=259 /DNA_ID=CAMNT_0013383139 /DNA_START=92 /DNA_END=871 /DNA_ORIENTATION=-